MSGLLAALEAYFVETREDSAPVLAPPGPAPDTAAVIGAGRHARIAGAALALRLLAEVGGGCAALCAWTATHGYGAPAVPAARRAATALRDRDMTASAGGRLVRVALTGGDEQAGVLFQAGAVVRGPAVLIVDRPRTDAIDAVLARVDLLVLVEPADEILARAATRSLAALGPRTTVQPSPRGGIGSVLALAGVAPMRGGRAVVVAEAIS